MQCSTTQSHRNQNWEDTSEEPKWISDKSIHDTTNFDNLSKKQEAIILFVDFAKAFESIHRGKMEQILLAYSLPKETVAAIMMLYRNTKVKVCSPDGDTDYFDIVTGMMQGVTLAPYLFIICLDDVLRTSIDKMKDNGFKLTKERSRRYPTYNYGRGRHRWQRFWQTHPPKPKHCYIVWKEHLLP